MSSTEGIWSAFCHRIYFFVDWAEAAQWCEGRGDHGDGISRRGLATRHEDLGQSVLERQLGFGRATIAAARGGSSMTQTIRASETSGAATEAARRTGLFTTGRSLGLGLLAGAGGAWIGTLTTMEPYRPYFMGLTLVFLGLAFRKLYLAPRSCAAEETCGTPRTLRRQRALF